MSLTDLPLSTARPGLSYRVSDKRCLDLALALMLLPLLAPVIAMLALAIRCDGGPAFFVHRRIGRGGRPFGCLKLRTMRADAEAALAAHLARHPDAAREWARSRKLRDDPRITHFGHVLRRTSLDELPQVWNVLRGEMSFVGPRPVTRAELARYGQALPVYLSLRPGVTGLWQVGHRQCGSYRTRVLCDRLYATGITALNDLRIILRSAAVLVRGTGS